MARIVDWDYWRHKFVTGEMSLKELSEGHNAPAFKTLRNKSSAQDWPGQRQKFRDVKRTQAATEPDVQQTADEVRRIIDTAEMLTRHVRAFRLAGGKGMAKLATIDPSTLTVKEALDLLKWGVDGERLTEGLATQRQAIDLSGLSDAELEKLANGGA